MGRESATDNTHHADNIVLYPVPATTYRALQSAHSHSRARVVHVRNIGIASTCPGAGPEKVVWRDMHRGGQLTGGAGEAGAATGTMGDAPTGATSPAPAPEPAAAAPAAPSVAEGTGHVVAGVAAAVAAETTPVISAAEVLVAGTPTGAETAPPAAVLPGRAGLPGAPLSSTSTSAASRHRHTASATMGSPRMWPTLLQAAAHAAHTRSCRAGGAPSAGVGGGAAAQVWHTRNTVGPASGIKASRGGQGGWEHDGRGSREVGREARRLETAHGCAWLRMAAHGCAWLRMAAHGEVVLPLRAVTTACTHRPAPQCHLPGQRP